MRLIPRTQSRTHFTSNKLGTFNIRAIIHPNQQCSILFSRSQPRIINPTIRNHLHHNFTCNRPQDLGIKSVIRRRPTRNSSTRMFRQQGTNFRTLPFRLNTHQARGPQSRNSRTMVTFKATNLRITSTRRIISTLIQHLSIPMRRHHQNQRVRTINFIRRIRPLLSQKFNKKSNPTRI